ncbi:MAG: hypothetical protein MJA29_07165 [Candidatus Omnitrophica bacterium]|nr:hypothetical protein [Candidatus Omnitrophota bacterium]
MAKSKNESESKFFSIISYIGFFSIVALLFKKEDSFVLFHAKQGLVLFVFEVASGVLSVVPILGQLIGGLGFILFLCASLWGMFNALSGKRARIPVVSEIAEKINI